MTDSLKFGLYESLITRTLEQTLHKAGEAIHQTSTQIAADEGDHLFAQEIYRAALKAFSSIRGKDATEKVTLYNNLLRFLSEQVQHAGIEESDFAIAPPHRLLSVTPRVNEGLSEGRPIRRPQISLRESDLLVNGPRDVQLISELKREFASADRVDVLVAFLKWSGVRLLLDEITAFSKRCPGQLRVLTTTYMGATEKEAIDALIKANADVRISYDTRRTRLHAKAWLFYRETGYSTAYIGSSNLSHAAMVDGLEWNVRLSQIKNPGILNKFHATFEQYWNDTEFERYQPEIFQKAADEQKQKRNTSDFFIPFAIRPFSHQKEILDALKLERDRGHKRNLVVAATGTGKTVVSALDFSRLIQHSGEIQSLLFVAHRAEILKQARSTFRHVLHDGNFGELLVGGVIPKDGEHVFASIQSLHARRLESLPADHFDMVIIDEFHHAEAPTYRRLLDFIQPKILLGLTATPERADGQDILVHFDHRIAAEIRLWDALERNLLSPFHYFGVADETNLSQVRWERGGYDTADLERLYTGNDVRSAMVLRELKKRIRNPFEMRALGFCVGINHADFMARKFRDSGLIARAYHSRIPKEEREATLTEFRRGKIHALFTVDMFNEGVDVPEIDTVLFLRPTQSATIFLQQLGRGLRISEGKECLTVLDFIGNHHQRFRFDIGFRALLGLSRKELEEAVEESFPRLPSGCSMQLDRQSTQWVLTNLKQSLQTTARSLVSELRALGDVSLRDFLKETGLSIPEFYRAGRTWTELRRLAEFETRPPGLNEGAFLKRLGDFAHVDDEDRLDVWRLWLSESHPPTASYERIWERRLREMFFGLINGRTRALEECDTFFQEFWGEQPVREELLAVCEILADGLRQLTFEYKRDCPFRIHGTYALSEIMSGFGITRSGKIVRPQTGVWYEEPLNTDLFFVTLEKSGNGYSPTTLYNDYVMSSQDFHWESQNRTAQDSPTGKRYLSGTATTLLFVRETKKQNGWTMPYRFLGPAHLLSSSGERPMQIIWRLEREMPLGWYRRVKLAAG